MAILPHDEASLILRHYIKTLAERSGMRWTPQNDADFDRVADLLSEGEELDVIPPFGCNNVTVDTDPPALTSAVTQELDYRDEWEERQLREFAAWKAARAEDERYATRMRQ